MRYLRRAPLLLLLLVASCGARTVLDEGEPLDASDAGPGPDVDAAAAMRVCPEERAPACLDANSAPLPSGTPCNGLGACEGGRCCL